MPLARVLITDVDNTLYDFGRYFEAGLRGLVDELRRSLDATSEDVLCELKLAYASRRTIDYPFIVEELGILRKAEESLRREVARTATEAFWRSAVDELTPYPSVVSTLRELRRRGVAVVAVTDAPIYEALRRLRVLRLTPLMTGLVATNWFPRRRPGSALVPLSLLPGFSQAPRRFTILRRLQDDERKPNPEIYRSIAAALGAQSSATVVIGDSAKRDVLPAYELGMQAILARYGRRNVEKEPLLQSVVPFKLPEVIAREEGAPEVRAVDRFSQLLCLFTGQLELPLD